PAPRFLRQSFAVAVVNLTPGIAAISRLIETAAWTARSKRPSFSPKIPQRGVHRFRIVSTHGHQAASGRRVGSTQNFFPGFSSVGGLVNATLVVIVPKMPGGTNQHAISVFRIDKNLRNVLGVVQTDVVPVFAAIGRLIHTVSNRNTVAHPGFSGADPNVFGIRGIDGNRPDRLHSLAIEHGLESCATVDRFPDSPARRAYEQRQTAILRDRIEGGDASAHGGRADVSRR